MDALTSLPAVAAGVAAFLIVLNATAFACGYVVGRFHERHKWVSFLPSDKR